MSDAEADRTSESIRQYFSIAAENRRHFARVLEIYEIKNPTTKPKYREVIAYDMGGIVCSVTKTE